jgi:hypothetical protein
MTLRSHWHQLLDATLSMSAGPMVLAFVLCLIHRLVNAHGWTMVLRALGQPMPAARGARIWLTSEACRWLPGSVWSYGSRGVQAAKAGVSPVVAVVSMLWELILTLMAWGIVVAAGIVFWKGPIPETILAQSRWFLAHPWLSAFGVLAAVLVVGALGSKSVSRRLGRLVAAGRDFGRVQTDRRALIGVLGFYVMMAVLNGLTFWQVVRASPGGDRCPVTVVLAANSLAWIIGLCALFAPGGLVVREASIGVLLSGWLPIEQAVSVALAWRAIQVAGEISSCLVIALPGFSPSEPGRTVRSVCTEGVDV